MSFTARTYPEIVRDLLVALTRGVVGESVLVPPVLPDGHLFFLGSRPVRRVSRVEGMRVLGDETVPWVFTEADWELVSSTGRPEELDALRFRVRRPSPAPGTALRVSYWPREVPPLPLTDLNVGSVTRTLLETLAREMADQYVQLDHVYRSAFLETAEGSSLDKVVALVGIERLPAAIPRGKVRFHRKPGIADTVNLPAGTVLLAGKDARYRTTRQAVLQPGETSVEVAVAGETRSTPVVEAGEIDRLARALAGIERAGNDAPTWQSAEAESDDDLRARARAAFHAVGSGTADALRWAVAGLPFVNGVQLVEPFETEPGVVQLDVAMAEPDNAEHKAIVAATIEGVRPLGIHVRWGPSAGVSVVIDVKKLVLAGAAPPPLAEIQAIQDALSARLADAVRRLPPGGRISAARLLALALSDERVADVELAYKVGGASVSEPALPAGKTAVVATPLSMPAPVLEQAAGSGPTVQVEVRVAAVLLLGAGATLAAARSTLRAKTEAWVAKAKSVEFGAFAAAVQEGAPYTLVRDETTLTLETAGRFEQVRDGGAARPVGAGETLRLGSVDALEWREP